MEIWTSTASRSSDKSEEGFGVWTGSHPKCLYSDQKCERVFTVEIDAGERYKEVRSMLVYETERSNKFSLSFLSPWCCSSGAFNIEKNIHRITFWGALNTEKNKSIISNYNSLLGRSHKIIYYCTKIISHELIFTFHFSGLVRYSSWPKNRKETFTSSCPVAGDPELSWTLLITFGTFQDSLGRTLSKF